MRKFVKNTCFILLFLAAAIGITFAIPSRQGGSPETIPTETDYELFVAKKEHQLALANTPEEKKRALAEKPDVPFVSISGKVVMPDGSPLPKEAPVLALDIFAHSFELSEMNVLDGTKQNYVSSHGRGRYDSTKKDGTFLVKDAAPLGANVLLEVFCNYSTNDAYKQLLSKPIVFAAHPGMKPLEIKLEKGIPLRGKLSYDNGSPAAEQGLHVGQYVEPILGADIPELHNAFRTSRWINTDTEGDFEIFLLPGEYVLRDEYSEQMLMITEMDKEKKLDLIQPTPIFVEIKDQDGSFADEIDYVVLNDTNIGTSSASAQEGKFVIKTGTDDRRLYVMDKKFEQGTHEIITPEMNGKPVQFVLKPVGKVQIKLVDTTGNPVVEQEVGLSVCVKGDQSSARASVDGVKTDSEGKAVLRVAPGKYAVTINLPGDVEEPLPGGGKRIFNSIDKKLNLASGETLDLGTVCCQVLK